jgi:hypothetical protein
LADNGESRHADEVNVRIAVGLMTKSKAELIAFWRDEPEAAQNVTECLAGSRESLEENS